MAAPSVPCLVTKDLCQKFELPRRQIRGQSMRRYSMFTVSLTASGNCCGFATWTLRNHRLGALSPLEISAGRNDNVTNRDSILHGISINPGIGALMFSVVSQSSSHRMVSRLMLEILWRDTTIHKKYLEYNRTA